MLSVQHWLTYWSQITTVDNIDFYCIEDTVCNNNDDIWHHSGRVEGLRTQSWQFKRGLLLVQSVWYFAAWYAQSDFTSWFTKVFSRRRSYCFADRCFLTTGGNDLLRNDDPPRANCDSPTYARVATRASWPDEYARRVLLPLRPIANDINRQWCYSPFYFFAIVHGHHFSMRVMTAWLTNWMNGMIREANTGTKVWLCELPANSYLNWPAAPIIGDI